MKNHLEDSTRVGYRLLAVPTKNGYVSGFALVYSTEITAEMGFNYFHEYLDARGFEAKLLTISLDRTSPQFYTLTIYIVAGHKDYLVQVANVEASDVFQIRESLNNFQFFFIFAAYKSSDNNLKLLPVDRFNYFRQVIYIDGETVVGTPRYRWPRELFEIGDFEVIGLD